MPALRNGDLILLDTGDAVRLLSTDYSSMIVRYSDGRAASAPISAYRGLLQPASYSIEDTQEMPARLSAHLSVLATIVIPCPSSKLEM